MDQNILSTINAFNQEDISKVLGKIRTKSLHPEAFTEAYNHIASFINKSANRYADGNEQYYGLCVNSIMGHGKSTSLEYACRKLITDSDTPLLIVFKTITNMDEFYNNLFSYATKYKCESKILKITESNYDLEKSIIPTSQIVCIQARRFYDLLLGYGNYETFDYYRINNEMTLKRTIIIDEMPEFRDSELFNKGNQDNFLNWYRVFSKKVNKNFINMTDLRVSEHVIDSIFTNLFNQHEKIHEKSAPIGNLKQYVNENDKEKYETLTLVLGHFDNTFGVSSENKKRMKWFKELLETENVAVINRDDSYLSVLCSRYIDYLQFGNVLILDGTADIVEQIYNCNGFEVVKCKNYHDYKKRLVFHYQEINTTKDKRLNDKTVKLISEDIFWLQKQIEKTKKEMFPLVTKSDVEAYYKTGVISNKILKYYKENNFDEDSKDNPSISLLNAVGTNILNEYSVLTIIGLPIRNPIFYKLHAIAIWGTEKNIGLETSFDEGYKKKSKYDISWFVDVDVQKLYEALVLSDYSQIIHRINIRNLNRSNSCHIIMYTQKAGFIELFQKHFGIVSENIRDFPVIDAKEFRKTCRQKLTEVKRFIKKGKKDKYSANEIVISGGKDSFKNWVNYNTKSIKPRIENGKEIYKRDLRKLEIIEEIAEQVGIKIEVIEKEKTSYRYFSIAK